MLKLLTTILLAANGGLPEITPADDFVITESVRVKPGEYVIRDEGEPGVLRIEGKNLVVVLDGVTIHGSKEDQEPDTYAGTGIVVKGDGHILHGGALHGFKVAVQVDGGEDHWLIGMDVGRNFAQRLKSTPDREDSKDWLWPHKNDDGEWAANYGAGIWVRGAKGTRVLACRGYRSQNGILLDRTEGAVVRGCDFSFNSGWGIALWRSSRNRIESNRFDWCVRGYAHGVYDRGQDSAGILVFEQCHENEFRGNSATHSGDGFFLYAGHETTQRTGKGGCNGNVVVGNDFSHAVANGIEATFSEGNRFEDNRLDDCNYGIWAGYSRKSTFARNVARGCTYAGIAIEHGSENEIRGNLIENSRRGVWLWWDQDKQFLESVYGKNQRTDSADTLIEGNVIRGGQAGVYLVTCTGIRVVGNQIEGAGEAVVEKGDGEGAEVKPAEKPVEQDVREWADPPNTRRGRRHIIMREWGPFDYSEPILHPARIEGRGTARFAVLGPPAEVEVLTVEGEVRARVERKSTGEPQVIVSPRVGAGSYLPFSFTVAVGDEDLTGSGILLDLRWTVRFWSWEKDPRGDAKDWAELTESPPAVERVSRALDFTWAAKGPGGEMPPDRFATVAETVADLPAGRYEIVTVSDDGVRVVLDGKTVVEDWTHHGPKEDRVEVEIAEGKHELRVEHFEIDGYAKLVFRLRKLE